MSHSVGQVSAFAGATVRTPHHHDKAGLLSPGERSRAGYRLYGGADLARLRQTLFHAAAGAAHPMKTGDGAGRVLGAVRRLTGE
ncbi:hypothetical protein SUDANB176_02579 [Streptomyces sp. enrichment culture]